MCQVRALRWCAVTAMTVVVIAVVMMGWAPVASAGTAVDWQEVDEETLSDDVVRWVDAHKTVHGVHVLPAGTRRYLLLSWGEQPTGGYTIAVDAVRQSADDLITVSVALSAPGPDDMVIQVLTYPYLLIELPGGDETLLVNFRGASWLGKALGEPDDTDPLIVMDAVTGADGTARNPLVVRGRARLYEATMDLVIEDGHYQLVNQWLTLAAGGPAWAEFEVAVMYPDPSQAHGTVIGAYQSAMDGSLVEVAYEPVVFGSRSRRLPDVDGHWAESSIRQGVWAGFIDGYPDGTFVPQGTVTRAEFLKLLVAGVNGGDVEYEGTTPFGDAAGHWVEPYLGWATETGWVSVDEDGPDFCPDQVVSRQVMARWAARAAGLTPGEGEPVFSDLDAADETLQPWVTTAAESGLLMGYPDGSFHPEAGLTRAEAVTVVLRALDLQ